jgi:hypothetical protein
MRYRLIEPIGGVLRHPVAATRLVHSNVVGIFDVPASGHFW